jgi:predicted TIM-barrel fold metal-dependent hydrolase
LAQFIFKEIKALIGLGYFYLDFQNKLNLKDGITNGIIDFHTTLGWNYFLGKPVDLTKTKKLQYFFPDENIPVDLSHYSTYDFTPELTEICKKEMVKPSWDTSAYVSTHTIPNLTDEMQRMKIKKSVIFTVDLPGSNNSEHILNNIDGYDNLISYISIHPLSFGKKEKLKKLIAKGAKGIKIHLPLQMIKPLSKAGYKMYKLANEFKLPILLHSGHSPMAPEWHRRYTSLDDYEKIIRSFPDITFILVHAAIDDYRRASELGKKYDNVYLELSGQPPAAIREIINIMGSDKLIFGSHWPFYPIALSLAKVLLATENNGEIREKILSLNAQNLLKVRSHS